MTLDEAAEEIKTIYIEAEFGAHMAILEANHAVGKILLSYQSKTRDFSKFLQTLAQKVGKSERTLWYAAKFAEKFPVLDSSLPEGKNLTWNKIITKYLTSSQEQANTECIHEPQLICRKCRAVLIEKV